MTTDIFNAQDPASETNRMRVLADMEREPSLEEAKEVALYDMTEAELAVVIVQDPDASVRREALRMYRQTILLDAETKVFNLMGDLRKVRL